MRPENRYYPSQARERMIQALLSLMEKYPFEEITILQITQEAAVARRTFYLYYNSKTDVLEDYYDVLAREFYEDMSEETVHNNHLVRAELFFAFWKEHRSYLKLLHTNHMLSILMSRFDEYLMRMIVPQIQEGSRYYAAFYAGGLWSIMFTWIEHEFQETPAELAAIAEQFDYKKLFTEHPLKPAGGSKTSNG